MRSAVGVGRTDATLDCIATGGFLDPSALVKALPSSFHLLAHQRSAGYKSLKKKTNHICCPITTRLFTPNYIHLLGGIQQGYSAGDICQERNKLCAGSVR